MQITTAFECRSVYCASYIPNPPYFLHNCERADDTTAKGKIHLLKGKGIWAISHGSTSVRLVTSGPGCGHPGPSYVIQVFDLPSIRGLPARRLICLYSSPCAESSPVLAENESTIGDYHQKSLKCVVCDARLPFYVLFINVLPRPSHRKAGKLSSYRF